MMKALIWVMLCGLTMALPAQDDPQNEALNIIDVDEAKQSIGDVISDVIDEIGDVISDMCQEIVEVNELIDDKVLMTKDICLTRQCIEASNRLFQNMREDADPCEDFNEFACGRFETETIIPDDAGKYTSLSLIQDIVLERLRQLLEAEIDEKTDFEGHKKAKIYYKSCMNEDKQEALGVEPIKEYLAKYGGWPVLEGDKWSGDNFDLWALLAKESFNNNILVNTKIASDAMNSSWRVIHFDQTSLGLSREYLVKGFEEKEVKSYFK
jgi:membrane metallo-endopeptidase-like protein 1